MKSDRNILIAFILNLTFSIFEFIGGAFTGSVAISSDALHDLGDASSIGISYFMERKSKKGADDTHHFGYGRYSVLGGWITSLILLLGSMGVIAGAADRLRNPIQVHHTSMLIFAIIGVIVNFIAAKITSHGQSTNQRAVNLHMLEDMMGWIAVLVGSIVMHFTNWTWIDPVLSILVALTVWYNALLNLIEITHILLEKAPKNLDIQAIHTQISALEEVSSLDTIRIWNINSDEMYAIIHIVTIDPTNAKQKVRQVLLKNRITQSTIECNEPEEIAPVFTVAHHANCNCGHHHHHFPRIPFKNR